MRPILVERFKALQAGAKPLIHVQTAVYGDRPRDIARSITCKERHEGSYFLLVPKALARWRISCSVTPSSRAAVISVSIKSARWHSP